VRARRGRRSGRVRCVDGRGEMRACRRAYSRGEDGRRALQERTMGRDGRATSRAMDGVQVLKRRHLGNSRQTVAVRQQWRLGERPTIMQRARTDVSFPVGNGQLASVFVAPGDGDLELLTALPSPLLAAPLRGCRDLQPVTGHQRDDWPASPSMQLRRRAFASAPRGKPA
jgi:hypothetical protein